MDRICTQYGVHREADTWVDPPPAPEHKNHEVRRTRDEVTRVERPRKPPRPRPRGGLRFVITIPQHLAEDFGISPAQIEAEHYAIDCSRRPLARR